MAQDVLAPEPRYGGFWIRLGAFVIDVLILSPFVLFFTWVRERNRSLYYLTYAAIDALYLIFNFLLVKWRGGSPGKLLSGLRIVTLEGKPVGWKEVWLRESVNLVSMGLSKISSLLALRRLTDEEFSNLGSAEGDHRLYELEGSVGAILFWVGNVWVVGELVVLLMNRRRRALHDFIAGTLVVHDGKSRGFLLWAIVLGGIVLTCYFYRWLHPLGWASAPAAH